MSGIESKMVSAKRLKAKKAKVATDEGVSPLAFVTDAVIERMRNGQLPWQTGDAAMMPTNVSGRQIPNINFLHLVGKREDHRWGAFLDFNSIGASIISGEVAAESVVQWKSTKKADGSGTYARPLLVKLFNASQTNHKLPQIERMDVMSYALQIEGMLNNAGIKLSYDPDADVFYDNGTIYADLLNPTDESIAKALFGLAQWSQVANDPSEITNSEPGSPEYVRKTLKNAIIGSMLCAEYGVPVPQGIVDQMARYHDQALDYLVSNRDELMRISREAWDMRQHVIQYTPMSSTDDEPVDDDAVVLAGQSSLMDEEPSKTFQMKMK